MSFVTLFTAPKPFTDPLIRTIQCNAIRNWTRLGGDVQVILMGEEPGLAEEAADLGVLHLPDVQRNEKGTPLVNSMFDLARRHSQSPLLCCINADILLLPDFIQAARDLHRQADRFLMVGQRWDLEITEELDFSPGWDARLRGHIAQHGCLHPPAGSDYFLFPRDCFTDLPPLAIGRAGWDNWMIYAGRRKHWAVVDATASVQVVHQNHDYRHLPGGQPHYRLPESDQNIRLGGGRRTIFSLQDASYRLAGGKLSRPHPGLKKVLREVEIAPLVHLGSVPLAHVFFALFHPARFYGEVRGWLQYKLSGK